MPEPFVPLGLVLGGAGIAGDPVFVPHLGPSRIGGGDALDAIGAATSSCRPGDETVIARDTVVERGRDLETTVRELTLMRLAAFEAYARARTRLVERLARDVLGRELALSDLRLEAIARRVLARFRDDEPLALRVSPEAAAALAVDVPVHADPSLGPGDLIVELRDGEVDARFHVRFSEAVAPEHDGVPAGWA